MQVFYTPRYYADIGPGHVFPIRKFELVRDKLLAEGTLEPAELIEPSPAPLEDVLLVHTSDYVSRLCNGTLTTKEIRRPRIAMVRVTGATFLLRCRRHPGRHARFPRGGL